MNDQVPMEEFLQLGKQFMGAMYAESPQELHRTVMSVRELADKCGLPKSLDTLDKTVLGPMNNAPSYPLQLLPDMKQRLFVIDSQMMSEANAKQMIVLASNEVSTELLDLPKKRALTDTQKHLVEETIRCL
jgi:hypothetical protein